MKNKGRAAIFLNGAYPAAHREFYIDEYRRESKRAVIIAVDGGWRFLADNQLRADLVIGDMDSLGTDLQRVAETEIVTVPGEGKNLTDGELALDWCVKKRLTKAIIYGGVDTAFETDHLLGNVLMLFAFKADFDELKMRDFRQEIIALQDESYSARGKPGDLLSLVPLSEEVTYYAQGLKYDPAGAVFKFGRSQPLRNELTADRFKVSVSGRALLIIHFS